MIKICCRLMSIILTISISFGQTNHIQDSIATAQRDSTRMAKFIKMAYFPIINAGPMSGVLPVQGVDEIPDPARDYKLLFEFTLNTPDSTHKKINGGLVEIARVINLHVASGIPIAHIHAVVLVHGPSLFSVLNNETFEKKYQKDNPNIKLIQELQKDGIRFIVCGQYMTVRDVKKEQLLDGIKLSLTAKTVLSNYIGQGYVWYDISEEK